MADHFCCLLMVYVCSRGHRCSVYIYTHAYKCTYVHVNTPKHVLTNTLTNTTSLLVPRFTSMCCANAVKLSRPTQAIICRAILCRAILCRILLCRVPISRALPYCCCICVLVEVMMAFTALLLFLESRRPCRAQASVLIRCSSDISGR